MLSTSWDLKCLLLVLSGHILYQGYIGVMQYLMLLQTDQDVGSIVLSSQAVLRLNILTSELLKVTCFLMMEFTCPIWGIMLQHCRLQFNISVLVVVLIYFIPQSDCLFLFLLNGNCFGLMNMVNLWMICNLYVFCEWCQNSVAVMAVGFHYGEIQMARFWQITICWGDTVVSRPSSSDMVCWIFVNAMLPKAYKW